MDQLLEDFKAYLPKYLTAGQKSDLLAELRKFPASTNYFLRGGPEEELLQGDGWRGFVALDFDTAERRQISGVILSNSCDIDARNRRDHQPNILFAPIMRLSSFVELLGKREPREVESKLESIRRQEVTSLFYLPAAPAIGEECLVNLDDLHSHPLSSFLTSSRARLFRLNQTGFYLFLFKLSIHFTRFGESLARFDEPEAI